MNNSSNESLLNKKAFWSFVFLWLGWIFYFWPTLVSIYAGNQQNWVIAATWGITVLAAYLIFAMRKLVVSLLIASSQLGLLCLFLMISVYVAANVLKIQSVEQSAVILMIPALVLTVCGPAVTKTLILPLLFFLLVIPLQDSTLYSRPLITALAVGLFLFYLRHIKSRLQKQVVLAGTPPWTYQNSRWLIPTGIAFLMLMTAPWLGDNIRSFYPKSQRAITLRAPLGTKGWDGPKSVGAVAWEPVFPNASATLQAKYFSNVIADHDSVYLYSAYYHSDRSAAEMLDPRNSLYDPTLWKGSEPTTVVLPIGENDSVSVFEITLKSGSVSRLVWYWYYIAGVSTVDVSLASLLDKVRVISKYAQGSGVILVSTSYEESPEEARKRLGSFMSVMYSSLDILKRPEISYVKYNQRGK